MDMLIAFGKRSVHALPGPYPCARKYLIRFLAASMSGKLTYLPRDERNGAD